MCRRSLRLPKNKSPAKPVEACADGFEDRGSTPLASMAESEDCRAVALAKADPCERRDAWAASYDSACQFFWSIFVLKRWRKLPTFTFCRARRTRNAFMSALRVICSIGCDDTMAEKFLTPRSGNHGASRPISPFQMKLVPANLSNTRSRRRVALFPGSVFERFVPARARRAAITKGSPPSLQAKPQPIKRKSWLAGVRTSPKF